MVISPVAHSLVCSRKVLEAMWPLKEEKPFLPSAPRISLPHAEILTHNDCGSSRTSLWWRLRSSDLVERRHQITCLEAAYAQRIRGFYLDLTRVGDAEKWTGSLLPVAPGEGTTRHAPFSGGRVLGVPHGTSPH